MKKLHLNLHRIWFEKIQIGQKTEEYREISPYWCNILLEFTDKKIKGLQAFKALFSIFEDESSEAIIDMLKKGIIRQKSYHRVIFSNGYKKDRPQFECEFKSLSLNYGLPNWGAEIGKLYFVIFIEKI